MSEALREDHRADTDPQGRRAGRSQEAERGRGEPCWQKGKIVHITGAGHNVRRENKAQTLEVLRAFLSTT